jgi:hypothetical protein
MSIMLDTYPESFEVDSPWKFGEILLLKKLVLDFIPSFNAAPVPGALQRAAP